MRRKEIFSEGRAGWAGLGSGSGVRWGVGDCRVVGPVGGGECCWVLSGVVCVLSLCVSVSNVEGLGMGPLLTQPSRPSTSKLQGGRYATPCSRRAQHARLGSKCEIKRDAKTAQGCVLCTVGSSRASLLCRHRSPVAQNTNFFK